MSNIVTMKLQLGMKNIVLLHPLTCRLFPFLTVWCSQPETQSTFFDLKGQPALLVVINLAAAIRELRRKC